MTTMAQYVLVALMTWLPKAPVSTLTEVADSVAQASEQTGHGRQFALELAALAYEETRLAPWAVDGHCNDGGWRNTDEGKHAMRAGTCDGGKAFGAWQIHLYEGGPTATELTDLHTGARAAATLWATNPALWTPHAKASARARAWAQSHN